MADNNQQQYKDPQFYSRVKLYDSDQGYNLSFKYWKGMLVLEISKIVGGGSNTQFQDVKAAYFSPLKARMYAEELTKFLADPKCKPVGITLGSKDTTTAVTMVHDKNNDIMFICDITPDGKKEEEVYFSFDPNYHYAINYKNYESLDFEKSIYPNLDVTIIRDTLAQFADGMLGGYGYGTVDFMRFQNTRVNGNLSKIMAKLGIQDSSDYQRGSGSNNNFFNRNGAAAAMTPPANTGSNHRDDIDELDDLLDE